MNRKSKPYVARSLPAAQRRARYLRKQLDQAHELIAKFGQDRIALAKLAAKGPCFFNPLDVMAAEKIRDEILLKYCNLLPDGSFVKRG